MRLNDADAQTPSVSKSLPYSYTPYADKVDDRVYETCKSSASRDNTYVDPHAA